MTVVHGTSYRDTRDVGFCRLVGWAVCLLIATVLLTRTTAASGREPQRWAVILLGLPGDADHEVPFRQSAEEIQKWLTDTQRIPAQQIVRLPSASSMEAPPAPPLTAAAIRSCFADLASELQEDDALWIFTLGHGNYDGRRAWFHVAGRDPSHEDFGHWLADVRCREQVFWLTHSSSGWFVRPLSRPRRIIVAATAADDESNETEFPHAFASVVQRPISQLDTDHDGSVSVAELYEAVVGEVVRRFQDDSRLRTEHAQLDDNGDGVGSDVLLRPTSPDPATAPVPKPSPDGELARLTIIPYPEIRPSQKEQPTGE
jgi:hypothetical protein